MSWPDFVAAWVGRAGDDLALPTLGRACDFAFMLRCGEDVAWLRMNEGRVVAWATDDAFDRDSDFTLRAPPQIWEKLWSDPPPPRHQGLFALLSKAPAFSVEGSREAFAQNAHVLRRLMELARAERSGSLDAAPEAAASVDGGEVEPILGRYVTLSTSAGAARTYFETSGQGSDLLFLHTAGADGRQFHHLMVHPELLGAWRMVAFDLPGHGRSFPPTGAVPGSWQMTTDLYVELILALVDRLELRRPVVLGCSMGGEICLELALRHPDRFAGVVACEASDRVEGRQVHWARHPRVDSAAFVPEWVAALMSPTAPARYREEVWWTYSQGGHGTFFGDILFYSGDWDARERVGGIDTARCPVHLLTGEYDYSCTPELSRATAARIPGATFTEMPGLGHFPMAENPPAFLRHLLPVLEQLRGHGRDRDDT